MSTEEHLEKPNFVSGQRSTCHLDNVRLPQAEWNFARHGSRVITAGVPAGEQPEALESFLSWCRAEELDPLIFGCEQVDLPLLSDWDLTEIGKQPLFQAGPEFQPELSGPDQPASHRELRRQARRALNKSIRIEEITVAELWQFSQSGVLDKMFFHRWWRRGLAEFSFLVELNLEKGLEVRRAFVARNQKDEIVCLCFLLPCQRGWLLEHQILAPSAPNGTGELLLCSLLSKELEPDSWLSLGITPLYSDLRQESSTGQHQTILSFLPDSLSQKFLGLVEPLYGFRSLLNYRTKLEAPVWEPVYWAVPKRRPVRDTMAVLRAFAGGSFLRFGLETIEKWCQHLGLHLTPKVLPAINLFYVVTLFLWIPILWNLDGLQLFGNPLACKVWAIYDIFLVCLFTLHQRVFRPLRQSFLTDLLLGLVTADTVLAWIQTAMYHGGLPSTQPLGLLVFVINTAPISAALFLLLTKFSAKPLPFLRREQPIA